MTHEILLLIPCCILAFVNIRTTRREIIEGGRAPTIPLSSTVTTSDRVIVITGANAGIGRETALWFAEHEPSSTILLLCRNTSKGQQVIADAATRGKHIRVLACDLTSFASVRQCVHEIKSSYKTIDVLIQNAGVMLKDLDYTEDGHEMSLQANHLGHFLLSALLLPMMKQQQQGRVIVLTSSTFPLCSPDKIPYNDQPMLESSLECRSPYRYGLFSQYAKTKWCNILQASYLALEFDIWSAAVHPGLVRTDVVRNMPLFMRVGYQMTGFLLATLQKTPQQGCWGTIHAVHTNDTAGCYWENRRKIHLDEDLLRRAAPKVWEWSCDAVNLTKSERRALERCKKSR